MRSPRRLWALSKFQTATRTLSSSTSDNVLSIKSPSTSKDQVTFKIDEAVRDVLATKANFARKFDQVRRNVIPFDESINISKPDQYSTDRY